MRTFLASLGLALVLGVYLVFPSKASAASLNGVNLTTSPVAAAVSGKPGSDITTTLQVENNDSTAETINVELESFRAYGTSGAAQMIPFAVGDPSSSWVHFSQNSFVAQPGVWTSIKMYIDLPATASLGYYYTVIFKPQISNITHHLGSTIKGGNAILVLVNALSGNEHPQIQVTNFSADKKLYEYLPATFTVNVKNTGNIFLAPSGDIYISRSSNFTSTIDTIPVNMSAGNVLAGTSRIFTQQWTDGFPVFVPRTVDGQEVTNKKGQVEQALKWDFSSANKFRFGKYYAKLVLVYSNGSRDIPIEATVSFWVIPWKLLSIIAVVLILTMVGLYVSGHKLADRTFRLSKRVKRHKPH